MAQLNPPPNVLEISERLESEGFEAWCVGGAVRDALLGHPHLDWDLATSATPEQVRALFGRRRTIPVGIDFGTVGVLDRDGVLHEVTTFRRDVRTDGRHAEVEFGVSLDDDLARRDFTINAIAYSPSRDELRDPFGGRTDIAARLVRAVGDAEARMREDRLRALRAIRFAARFGFEIEPATHRAIEHSAPYLGRLSAERVKQELEKTMEQVRCPARALAMWRDTGALATLVPALSTIDDRDLAALDHLAVPGPSTRPQRRSVRLAALLAPLSAADAAHTLTTLRFSKHDASWISGLVERWHAVGPAIGDALASGDAPGDRQLRHWLARIGRLHAGPFMRLALARWAGAGRVPRPIAPQRARALYRRMLRTALRDPLDVRDLAVDGDDLRRSGIPPGPWLGKILHHLVACVLDDPALNRTDWLLQESVRYWRAEGGQRPQS